MARTSDRSRLRVRRHARVRAQVQGTATRPRLAVHRSNRHISAQLIDDTAGRTLVAASSMEKEQRAGAKTGANIEAASAVGKLVAERAVKSGIKDVVFDRGKYLYHGRIKYPEVRERGLAS